MADAMASLIGAQFAAKRKSPETALPEDESSFIRILNETKQEGK